MGKIILGGGGDEKSGYESHKYFYNELAETKKILYIPVALDSKDYPWHGCVGWLSNAFKDFGPISINMLTEFEGLSEKFLSNYDGIFVGGGNTFKLLNLFKRNGFDKLLKKYIEKGGVYYGGSAGAIIIGKTIDTASHLDKNEVALDDLSGLDLANGYSIWPHYTSSENENMLNWSIKNSKVIGIGVDSAVDVNSERIIEIGPNVVIQD